MGQVINLREEEYQLIMTELEKMHAGQLEAIRAVIEQMKEMAASEDTFSTVQTSANIVNLLCKIDYNIVELLSQAFQDSEAGVAKMIESTMTTDSIE